MGQADKKVLLLGAGRVSGPAINYLSRDSNTHITVVSQVKKELDRLSGTKVNVEVKLMDIQQDSSDLEQLITKHHIVVCLIPMTLLVDVAKMCIKHGIHVVTASYASPDMVELSQSATEKGVTVLTEMGLSPGIDHMTSMQCIDQVKQQGGQITSYVSWCGGLPAPEHSHGPLRYKFSWYPKQVLTNINNPAQFLRDGQWMSCDDLRGLGKHINPFLPQVVDITGNGDLVDATLPITFMPEFDLEGTPNRNSLKCTGNYGIQSASTILRGSLRYKGFFHQVKALQVLGLLDSDPHASLNPSGPQITWKGFMCHILGLNQDSPTDNVVDHIRDKVADQDQLDVIINLGLVGDDLINKKGTPIDTLSDYLADKLAYGPEERDMVLLHHDVRILWASGTREQRCIAVIEYGDIGGFSAMAKTVGLPIGISTKMILDGEIQHRGVVSPLTPDIYQPILTRLAQEGIKATEKIQPL